MTPSDQELIKKLTTEVVHRIPVIYGEEAGLASPSPERLDRRYSFMFRYWIKLPDQDVRRVLVKIPHESWMKTMHEAISSEHIREVVQAEFDVMTSIASVIEGSNHPRLFAIRPGACLSDLGALLVEEHPIRMLKADLLNVSIVFGSRLAWRKFEEYLELAGGWLRVIHTSFGSGVSRSLADLNVGRLVESELERIENDLAYSLKDLRELFRKIYPALQSSNVPLASLHNDYHLGNIFVTPDDRVGALDPNWVESGSIYEDLASLLIDPVTRKAQVISLGLLFRGSMRRRYENAILRGYYGDSNIPLAVIYFYCAWDVLVKWRMDVEILASDTSKLKAILKRMVAPAVYFYFHRLTLDYLRRGLRSIEGP